MQLAHVSGWRHEPTTSTVRPPKSKSNRPRRCRVRRRHVRARTQEIRLRCTVSQALQLAPAAYSFHSNL